MTLSNGATATFSQQPDGTHLVYTYQVGQSASQTTPDLSVTGMSLTGVHSATYGGQSTPVSFYSNPIAIASGDFDGDGNTDIVTANQYGHTISVLSGNGSGKFALSSNYDIATVPSNVSTPDVATSDVAVADVNGDDLLDIVATLPTKNAVAVWLNNGDGTFGAPTLYAAGAKPNPIALADINGDGKIDAVVGSASGISVLFGDGHGGFGPPTTYGISSTPYDIALGDLNGDGRLDIVETHSGSGDATVASILFGDGKGGFGAPTNYVLDDYAYGIALADINGDGFLDLATTSRAGVAVRLNDGTGALEAALTTTLPGSPNGYLAARDINNDGIVDLVSIDYTFEKEDIDQLTGDGSGGFTVRAIGSDAQLVNDAVAQTIIDINGQGLLAVVTPGFLGSSLGYNFLFDSSLPVSIDTSTSATAPGHDTGLAVDGTAPLPPTLSLANDTGSSSTDKLTRDPTIAYTKSSPSDTLLYTLDGGAFSTTLPVLATDGSADGSHTIAAEEVNAAGDPSIAGSLTFKLDTTGPVISALPNKTVPKTSANGAPVSFSATATDAVDGADAVVFRQGTKVLVPGQIFTIGVHQVTATATDAAGNVSTKNFTITVTTPTLTVSGNTDFRTGTTIVQANTIEFGASGAARALFNASQFNGSQIVSNPVIVGDTAADSIGIVVDTPSFSAAGFTLLNWTEGQDYFIIYGGASATSIGGTAQDDEIFGGAGSETITPGIGNDTVFGGGGTNTISYAGLSGGVLVNLEAHEALKSTTSGQGWTDVSSALAHGTQTDMLMGIADITGTAFDDRLYGDANANLFTPGAGSDVIYGNGGADAVSYAGLSAGVYVDLAARFAYKETAAGVGWADPVAAETSAGNGYTSDFIAGVSTAVGTSFDDRLYGAATGGGALSGGAGNDIIYGVGGRNMLDGGTGDDKLVASGNDTMTGGVGADAFIFTSTAVGGDTIGDFSSGVDVLDFAAGHVGTYAKGQSVSLVQGTGSSDAIFGAQTTQGFAYDTSSGRLYFDADGAGGASATLMATLTGAPVLKATDFIIY